MVLKKGGHKHALAEELRHRFRVRAALGRKARSFESSKDRSVPLNRHEGPLGPEHTCHPPLTVPAIDPDHADVQRSDARHLDPVAVL